MNNKIYKRIGASFLAVVMAVTSMAGNAIAAAPGETGNNPGPDQQGYVHLTQYTQPTDIPDVYKVEIRLEAPVLPPRTDVVIVMDNSGSMILDQNGTQQGGAGVFPITQPNKWGWARTGAKEAVNVFLNPEMNPGASKTRVGIAAFSTTGLGSGFPDAHLSSSTVGFSGLPPTAPMTTMSQDGFISYDKRADLQSAIEKMPQNAAASGTPVSAGFAAAGEMFKKAEAADPEYHKVRKFILFLSDGAETQASNGVGVVFGPMDTLAIATELKRDYGVQIYSIGLGLWSEASMLPYNKASRNNWNKRNPLAQSPNLASLEPIINGTSPIPWDNGYFDIPGDQYIRSGGFPASIQEMIYLALPIDPTHPNIKASTTKFPTFDWTYGREIDGIALNNLVGGPEITQDIIAWSQTAPFSVDWVGDPEGYRSSVFGSPSMYPMPQKSMMRSLPSTSRTGYCNTVGYIYDNQPYIRLNDRWAIEAKDYGTPDATISALGTPGAPPWPWPFWANDDDGTGAGYSEHAIPAGPGNNANSHGYGIYLNHDGPPTNTASYLYNADTWNGRMPTVDFADSQQETIQLFEEFARKMISFGEDITVSTQLDLGMFSIYRGGIPGETLIDNWYQTFGTKGQTAKLSSDGRISWDPVTIPLKGANTLVFYVKIDSSKVETDKWYSPLKDLYISFIDNMTFSNPNGSANLTLMVKNFPVTYVRGKETKFGAAPILHDETTKLHSSSSELVGVYPAEKGTVGLDGTSISLSGPMAAPQKPNKASVKPTTLTSLTITTKKAKVYDKTALDKKAIANVKDGEIYKVLGTTVNFYKIKLADGKTAYIAKSDIKAVSGKKTTVKVAAKTVDKK